MKRITRLLAACAIAPLAAMTVAAVPPGADPESCVAVDATDDESPELCTIRTWAQCDTALAGKGYVAAVSGTTVPVTIDAPTGTATGDGEGCGTPPQLLFRGTTQSTAYSTDFRASITGNIDALTLELHALVPVSANEDGSILLPLRVSIDGESLFGSDADGPITREVVAMPIESSTGASSSYRVTITDIGLIEAVAGGGTVEHDVLVTVDYPQLAGVPVYGLGGVFTWVWGAEEVPTGFIVNPGSDEDLGSIVRA